MIESITLSTTSSFGSAPEKLDGLSEFNFLFGANGTGKTTISRVIADDAKFPSCNVAWKGGTKLQPLVYNRDFVERNLSQSAELKGVFTLGENQVDTLNRIAVAKGELDVIVKRIQTLTTGLNGEDGTGGKRGESVALENKWRDTCWVQKQKHDAKLQGAFEGYRGNAEKFKGKVAQELATNVALLLPLADLEKKAGSLFGLAPTVEQTVALPDAAKLLAHEVDPILKKRVIGKDDVDIAAMIKKLGSSDWVRAGNVFYEANAGLCPFCQQPAPEALARSLNEYFDESFLADSKAIHDLATNYQTDSQRVQAQIDRTTAFPSRFLDVERLKVEKQLLDSKIAINIQRIASKRKEASQVVEVDSLGNVVAAIKTLIDIANTVVAEHNKMVTNRSQERATLTSQVWKFVLEELKKDHAVYEKERDGLDKAIDSMTKGLVEATRERAVKEKEIRELEKQTTSVQPTIDGINALLSSFGFTSFVLSKAVNGKSYGLVRCDGSDAKTTLSEGEKTFVTFLYFYHLLKGSDSESGMTTDRIVVFDDPVSSLDSDILFIVGSLIKGLFEEVREKKGHLRQIFILTHNVYFHREVSFNPNRRDVAMKEETFWVVRKSDSVSRIEKHGSNPIKTSYELLWAEVRRKDRSKLTIQNTLRRILENYFRILGGVDPDSICAMFEAKEKIICKSLFSWVNDGSHFAHDDLYVSIDGPAVDAYLAVFRAIFEKSDHSAHYKMMMGESFVENAPEAPGLAATVSV